MSHDVQRGLVTVDHGDGRDPLALLEPQPKPFTRRERDQVTRWLDELEPGGHCERWEVTCRQLEGELRDAREVNQRLARELEDLRAQLAQAQRAEARLAGLYVEARLK
jgi:DNA anti-recombination protein RmuC